MENYLRKVLITKGLDDPITFAKAQQRIADLEAKQIDSFNEYGPLNEHYLVITDLLLGAYANAGDTINQIETAETSYHAHVNLLGQDNQESYQAYLALGRAYLQDGQINEAQGVSDWVLKTVIGEQANYSWELYVDTLSLHADILFAKGNHLEELRYRKHLYDIANRHFGIAEERTILLRVALAYCYEKLRRFKEASEHYVVIRAYMEQDPTFATDAEKIGLTVHLARCYYMMGLKDDARKIYAWAYSLARRTYGPSSTLTKKTLRILKRVNRLA
ncbi:MAG: tetratricopeptide repeat protein [Sphaerochaeta sp.]